MNTYDIPRNEKVELYRSRTIAQVLNDTFSLIRLDFRLYLRSLFAISFAPMAVGLTTIGYGYIRLFSALAGINMMGDPSGFFSGIGMGSFGILFFLGILVFWVGTVLLLLVTHELVAMHRDLSREEMGEMRVGDVWNRIKGRIFWMLGSTFVWMVGIMVIGGAISLIPVAGMIGFYVLLVYTLFYFPLRIYEGRGMGQSFIVSAGLVSGAWWQALGFLILISLLTLVLVSIFTTPLYIGVIGGGTGLIELSFLSDESTAVILGMLYALLYATAYYLITAITVVAIIVYYHTRSEEKEGRSLEELVESIGQESGGGAPSGV